MPTRVGSPQQHMPITVGPFYRGAPELGSGRVVPAGTLIFARSGSGRNWLKKHGRNPNSVIFRELEYRIYLLNKIDQTD